MRTDAELLDALLVALAVGDVDAVGPLLTDDAEYVNPSYAMEAGTRKGREAVLTAVRALIDTFELSDVETNYEPVEGEEGRTLLTWRGPMRMRRFGGALPNDGAMLIDREGDLISRIAWFREADEARAAAAD